MNLRKLARGKPCMLRIPQVCNFNPETTVLAHIRRANIAGMGMKPPDICGVWSCDACHSVIDGRTKSPYSRMELDSMILRGLCRTLAELEELGAVTC